MLSTYARLRRPRLWKLARLSAFVALTNGLAQASTCYGTSSNGRLQDGVQLPTSGQNFSSYSRLGVGMGRTYLHESVHDVVLEAYRTLGKTAPGKIYVYGETGFERGGRIRPHRTHQNGTSVDFMVPTLNEANQSVALPSSPFNKFGYAVEFDSKGRIPGFRIDFEAMAEHLYQLSISARKNNVAIERVIFDPQLTERLLSSKPRGADLRRMLPFMKTRPWIRHDEHYHIDFRVSCLPLRARAKR